MKHHWLHDRNAFHHMMHWLNHLDLTRVKFRFWEDGAPSVVMYVLEAYSAGMAHMDEGTELHEDAVKKIRWTLDWMPKNQASRAGAGVWDYSTQWGSKLGGLPFHM